MGNDYFEDGLEGTAGSGSRAQGSAGRAPHERTDNDGSDRPVRRNPGAETQGNRGNRENDTRTGGRQQPVRRAVPRQRAEGGAASFSDKVAQIRIELERKKKRRRRIIAMIVAECLVLTAIFSYAYVSRLWNLMPRPNVNKENVENPNIPLESINKMQGYWMIAIFGVDSGTGTSSARGNSSDVNMIACINQDTGEIKLVSLYRDTYLKVSDKGTYRKFNYAYSEGGPEQALKMLNENLDLNITEYIIFNWKAVADGINILGGVDMEITKPEFKFINAFITETVEETGVGSHHLQSAGMNHLDGIQAVAYGRLRLMDSDYQRVERQKKVIQAAFDKAKAAPYSVLNNILVVCLQEVMTNLDFADLTNVALNVTKYHIGETGGFPFERSEANMGKARGACIIPQTLESNVTQLHQFLFGDEEYEPTEAVKRISEKISSDSGIYAVQSKPTTAAAETKETKETRKETTEAEESTAETDENGVIVAPVPGIGETDENGELIDGPEPDDEDPMVPGNTPGGTGYSGSEGSNPGTGQLPGGTGPVSGGVAGPTTGDLPLVPDSPGSGADNNANTTEGPVPGGAVTPGGTAPNGPTAQGGLPASGGTVTPGGDETPGGAAAPGGNTAPGGTSGPDGNPVSGGASGPSGSENSGAGNAPLGPMNSGGSDNSNGVITGPGTGIQENPEAGPIG